MTHKHLSFAAVAVTAALMGATVVLAQDVQTQPAPASSAPAGTLAKPSPYQGVSQPPANDVIITTDAQPEQGTQQPAATTAPVTAAPAAANSTPAVIQAAAPPSPEAPDDEDADADADTQPAPVPTPRLSRKDASSVVADEGVVTYVPGPANALPEGTVFDVRMLQNVIAADAAPGTDFRATLSQNLIYAGRVVVPIGSELRGKIVYVSYGRRISGPSIVHLRPEEFILPDGTRYHLHAEVIDTKGSDTKATGEGDISTKAHGKRAIVELAIGGGGGALIGAKLGGPAGAAVGSAIGAGVMGAHLLLTEQSVDLPEESTVIFSLTDPMFLNPTRD